MNKTENSKLSEELNVGEEMVVTSVWGGYPGYTDLVGYGDDFTIFEGYEEGYPEYETMIGYITDYGLPCVELYGVVEVIEESESECICKVKIKRIK